MLKVMCKRQLNQTILRHSRLVNNGQGGYSSLITHDSSPITHHPKLKNGFTLFELVVTVTILAILTLSAIPLMKISVKRQKEQELREKLREIRQAIKEFHRDTIGSPCTGEDPNATSKNPQGIPTGGRRNPTSASFADPRSRVAVCDPKIFTIDNPDRYPPSLEILVDGVAVIPRGAPSVLQGGQGLDDKGPTATQLGGEVENKIKKYLRELPIDPMTGEADWVIRSCYQEIDSSDWDGINVFDVRSRSNEKSLSGEKYSDW